MRFLPFLIAFAGLSPSLCWADDVQFYEPPALSPPQTLFGLEARDLTEQIKHALIEETGYTNLKSFAVYWDNPRCLVQNFELSEEQQGVCLVRASAFQVAATALVVKPLFEDEFQVSILDVRIE